MGASYFPYGEESLPLWQSNKPGCAPLEPLKGKFLLAAYAFLVPLEVPYIDPSSGPAREPFVISRRSPDDMEETNNGRLCYDLSECILFNDLFIQEGPGEDIIFVKRNGSNDDNVYQLKPDDYVMLGSDTLTALKLKQQYENAKEHFMIKVPGGTHLSAVPNLPVSLKILDVPQLLCEEASMQPKAGTSPSVG